MPPSKELIDKIAKIVSEAIDDLIPEAFVVYEKDMRLLMTLTVMLSNNKTIDSTQHKHMIDVLTLVWKHSIALTRNDMDMLSHGLDLAEAEQEAKEVKNKN